MAHAQYVAMWADVRLYLRQREAAFVGARLLSLVNSWAAVHWQLWAPLFLTAGVPQFAAMHVLCSLSLPVTQQLRMPAAVAVVGAKTLECAVLMSVCMSAGSIAAHTSVLMVCGLAVSLAADIRHRQRFLRRYGLTAAAACLPAGAAAAPLQPARG